MKNFFKLASAIYRHSPNWLKDTQYLFWIYLWPRWNILRHSDESAVKAQCKRVLGCLPNLDNPLSYNEKIQWMKLHWKDDAAKTCADKFLLREYVESKVGEKYLVPLIHVFEDASSVCFDVLPNAFALKASHASGFNVICKDKNLINVRSAERRCRAWMKFPYWAVNREWVYKDLKPRLVVEQLMLDESGRVPRDFKVFCFFGKPYMIQVDHDRFEKHSRDFYDMSWKKMDFSMKYPNSDFVMEESPPLYEIREVCRVLAKPFPQVRVDFYYVNGALKIGEMTFFPDSGLGKISPEVYGRELGALIDLDRMKKAWPDCFA